MAPDLGWNSAVLEDLQEKLTVDLLHYKLKNFQTESHHSEINVENFKKKFYDQHVLGFIDTEYVKELQNRLQRIISKFKRNKIESTAKVTKQPT
jgi:hypothetical protein